MLAALQLVAYLIWSGYQEAMQEAETKTRNYVAIFEARLDATLRRTDAVLQELVRSIPDAALGRQAVPRYAREFDAGMDSRLDNFAELDSLRVFDGNGELLYTSASASAVRANISDRSHFRRLRDNPGAGLGFSEVVISRVTGRQSMFVGRALRDGQGTFRGAVFAGLSLDHFQKLFRSLDLGPGGVIAIRRSDDFTQVVRWPPRDTEFGKAVPLGTPIRDAISAGTRDATIEFQAVTDGVVRIFSFRQLEGYPFFVLTALAREDVLAGWRARALAVGAAGLLLSLLLGNLLLRLWRAEVRLSASEELMRDTFEQAAVGIAHIAIDDYRILGANRKFCDVLGYDRGELIGTDSRTLTAAEEMPAREAARAQLVAGRIGMSFCERHMLRKDGSSLWVNRSLSLVRNPAGQPMYFISVIEDISERRRAEEQLALSEANLHAIAENASVGITVFQDGRRVFANRRAAQMLGYSVEEFLPLAIADVVHPDSRSLALERSAKRAAGEDIAARYEFTALTKDGRALPVEGAYAAIMWNGRPAYIVFAIDITERELAEAGRRASEQRYERVLRHISDALIVDDVEGRLVYANERFFEMFGIATRDLRSIAIETYVAPEWIAPLQERHHRRMRGEEVPDRFQYQSLRPDGARIWLDVTVVKVQENGRVIGTQSTIRDISERKRMEEALRLSEANLRAVAENASVGITILQDGRRVYANRRAAQLLGYSVEEFLQLGIEAVIHPDSRDRVPELLRRHANGEIASSRAEFTALTRDGRAIAMEGHYASTQWNGRPAIVACVDDISARKDAEEALRRSEANLRALADNATFGVAVIQDGRRVFANRRAAALLGYSAEEFAGLSITDAVHPDDVDRLLDLQRRRLAGESVPDRVEYAVLTKGGQVLQIEGSFAMTMWNGQPATLLFTADITERKALEAKLRQSHKMEAIGTLAGGIAHDFNNIVSAIIGNVELAREDVGAEHPATQSLDEIRKAGRRARDLVNQILTFSRQQQPPRRAVALVAEVEEVVGLLRATLPAGIEFDVRLAADAPSVFADPTQIHQILMNLCTNAWHAMDAGRGRIEIQVDSVVLGEEASRIDADLSPGRYARLSVQDSGQGMDAITRERVFEPFFTTKEVGEGTGLGLSVVHGIMRDYQGAITVDSQPGSGTSFHLYFPAADAAAEAAGARPAPAPSPQGRGQQVLYLDDDESLVLLVKRTLERNGYRVAGYTDSAEALRALAADPGRFDLVVTDYSMPGMSGLDVAREVARIRPGLPVAVTTGYITDELRERAPQAGVRELIYKPDSAEDLCETVQRLLEKAD